MWLLNLLIDKIYMKLMKKNLLFSVLKGIFTVVLSFLIFGTNAQVFEQQLFSKISSNTFGYHNVAIDTSGNLWTWGQNSFSQLGNDSTNHLSEPFLVMPDTKFSEAVAGNNFSAAIDENGGLWTWGNDRYGQLGNGGAYNDPNVKVPMQVADSMTFVEVVAGAYHLGAKSSDGDWYLCGRNIFGAIGDGNSGTIQTIVSELTKIEAYEDGSETPVVFTKLSLGTDYSMAVDSEGNIWGWGISQNKRHGLDVSVSAPVVTPTKLEFEQATKFQDVSAGYNHTLAIDTDGNLWAWGDDTFGQLGSGSDSTVSVNLPVQVSTGKVFSSIFAGRLRSYVIDESGKLYAMGLDVYNTLYVPIETNDMTVPVETRGIEFKTICPGTFHTIGLTEKGRVYGWGANSFKQMATEDYDAVSQLNEYVLAANGKQFESFADGNNFVVGLESNGDVWFWGITIGYAPFPVKVTGLPKIKSLSAHNHVLAIDENKNLWAWGQNPYGELGLSTSNLEPDTKNRTVPVQVTINGGAVTTFDKAFAGDKKSLLIDTDGHAWIWGYNGSGGIGDGTSRNTRYVPVQIAISDIDTATSDTTTITTFLDGAISSAADFSAIIDTSGNLWTCGYNYYGNLGYDTGRATKENWTKVTATHDDEPVKFTSVSLGWHHTLAIDTKGNVWAWGDDTYGALGTDDGALNRFNTAPIKILNGDYTYVSAVAKTSFAIDNNGKLKGWGDNAKGQLGSLVDAKVALPTDIMPEKSFKGTRHSGPYTNTHMLLQDTDGRMYVSGGTLSNGIIGDGMAWIYDPIQLNYAALILGVEDVLNPVKESSIFAFGSSYGIIATSEEDHHIDYSVYNILGSVVKMGTIVPGRNTISVPSGLFIFKAGDYVTKVYVK